MKRTFNTKIVIWCITLIIATLAVFAVYMTNAFPSEESDFLLIPLLVGLILSIIRTFNNISEKNKIINDLATQRDDSLDASKIKFNTCPDYWTRETKDGAVYCVNEFMDMDNERNIIGGNLATAGDVEGDDTEDVASNIGFKFAHSVTDNKHVFKDDEYTYIPALRKAGAEVVEGFEEGEVDGHDTVPHKHTRTFVDYAHSDKPPEWKDGVERVHSSSDYKDSKHMVIYNEDVYHDHSGNNNLYDSKGNLIWGKAVVSSSKSEDTQEKQVKNEFENNDNWISPLRKGDVLLAEINLTELNKKDNKCHLVKQFPWNEAKVKCDNVNVVFDQ